MGSFNISEFRTQGLVLGGARPSLFTVSLTVPFSATAGAERKFQFTCRAASFPADDSASIPVFFMGRPIKVAGDRNYPDWNVTVMQDEDMLVRGMMEKWKSLINTPVGNRRVADEFTNIAGSGVPLENYKTIAEVTQYSKDGTALRTYAFNGIFPLTVEPIPLNWEAVNQIENFNVTFSYDWWEPVLERDPVDHILVDDTPSVLGS